MSFAIYLDLDGVMADYAAGMVALGYEVDPALGRDLNRSGTHHPLKREMYERIKGTDFYSRLPLQEGAIALYQAAARVLQFQATSPIILTAAPKFGATEDDFHVNPHWLGAAYHKRGWVERVLLPAVRGGFSEKTANIRLGLSTGEPSVGARVPIDDERFICTTSARKWQFLHRLHAEHQVLIDDRIANVTAWAENGGVGIFHRSAEESIAALEQFTRDGIFAGDFKAVLRPGTQDTAGWLYTGG